MRSTRPLQAATLAAVLSCSAASFAAGPLGAKGESIQTSSYSIDLFQGPVLASSRVTALGGSYAGIAEGVEGGQVNPAAHSLRVPWSIDWFDWDWTLGFTLPSSLARTDFDNNGSAGFSYKSFLFATVGANMQIGNWGFGVLLDTQTYHLQELAGVVTVDPGRPHLSVELSRIRMQMSRSFFDGQLQLGAGARAVSMSFTASDKPQGGSDEDRQLFHTVGAAPEVGAIWAPHALPVRVGLTGRMHVRSETDPDSATQPDAQGDLLLGPMYLPEHVTLPWEIEAGVAWQIGRRKLNLPWINPHDVVGPLLSEVGRARLLRQRRGAPADEDKKAREIEDDRIRASKADARERLKARYLAMPRQKLLISASVLVVGAASSAVGVEAFMRQQVERSGRVVSAVPRLGIETELVPELLQVRVGSYLEPSRFQQNRARVHGTAGFDLRLFSWRVFGLFEEGTAWRAGGFVDGTRGYLGWGASVGVWH